MGERRAAWSSSRWLLVASAAVVVLCAGVPLFESWLEPALESQPSAEPTRYDPRTLAAVEVVLAPPQSGREPTLEGLIDGLVALKSRAIPVLVAVACGEVVLPEFAVGTDDEPIHPRAIQLREAAVAGALKRFPPAQIAERLRELCAGAPLDVSLVAAQLLGDCDDPSALDTLLAIARSIEPIQLQRTYVREPIQTALAKQFALHPAAIEHVDLQGDQDAWPVLVRAAGAARTATSARWLADLLGRNRELDLAVIEELGRSAQGGRFALPENVIERMRDSLSRHDDQMRRVAAVALGAAREAEAFDDLVGLLDETDPLIVAAARGGLREIAGTDFGLDPGAWFDWRVAQDEWYAERAEHLLDELDSGDAARASQAMSEMLAHSFFRHEWAAAIGALAVDAGGPLFATACATLAALGSARADGLLVEALDREDEHERELARDALRSLTGLDLPPEQAAWRSALEH